MCLSQEPEKHVFHIVTDTLNYGATVMWFRANPPGNATIQVQNVDTFQWLNSSYSPVLRQLETESMKAYFFKSDKERVSANLKYRNPKYLSMLNHLRFYLPEMFPTLDKILFLDDDVVVMKDLTPLWSMDLKGKVNGAVETCGKAFHRFDRYLNFSNPHIRRNFSPRDCGWAYGMNIFDLKEWRKRDLTGVYHKWQNLVTPGITFILSTQHFWCSVISCQRFGSVYESHEDFESLFELACDQIRLQNRPRFNRSGFNSEIYYLATCG